MKTTIQEALERALRALGALEPVALVEHPAELSHGDYASGAALRYAKELGLSSRDLAEKIVEALGTIEGVERIDIAGPGFINFHLSRETLAQTVERARAEDMWGSNDTLKKEEVLLEYTSPNLFKPLH